MRIAASLYAADPLHLSENIAAVAPHVAAWHVDVMDGRFAPAFGLTERLVRCVLAGSDLPVDVHVMVEDPTVWAPRFAALGVRSVAFHVEAVDDPSSLVAGVRAAGARALLALLPRTPLAAVARWLPGVDGVLLLTASAGGGPFDQAAFDRVRHLPNGAVTMVDGRLGPEHLAALRAAGVDIAVIGAALFENESVAERACELSALASGRPLERGQSA